jgi:hypothetical protein
MRITAIITFVFLSFSSCLFQKKDSSFVSCPLGFERVTVVNRSGLDGCGYMLQKADSSLYEVLPFPDSLQHEGKIICIQFVPSKRQASICMGGKMIELLNVR